MNKLILLLYSTVVLTTLKASAQTPSCDSVPLHVYMDSVGFTTASSSSFGDSMIAFNITNNHPTQGYAYPLAKLVPLTPLPAGMELSPSSQHWTVFASSWFAQSTMPVYIFYDVTTPIPSDYTVTFELWISNLTPTLPDSCVFNNTFSLNLNPSNVSVGEVDNLNSFHVYPNPANDFISIKTDKTLSEKFISIYNSTGGKVSETFFAGGNNEKKISVSQLPEGVYFISLTSNAASFVQRFILMR